VPAHILQPVYQSAGTIQNAEWNTAPTVGCGPFVFQDWQRGQSASFTANPNYWLGRPKLDEIRVRFVADDAAKVAALKSGEADLSVFLINSALYMPELQNAGAQILPVNSGYNEGWLFFQDPTNGHPALQDERVRQAIAMSLDRESMIRDLLGGQSQPAASYWDNTPISTLCTALDLRSAKAKQLLDEAGWVDSNGNGTRDKDGVELILTYGTTTNSCARRCNKRHGAACRGRGQARSIQLRLRHLLPGLQRGRSAAPVSSTSSNTPRAPRITPTPVPTISCARRSPASTKSVKTGRGCAMKRWINYSSNKQVRSTSNSASRPCNKPAS